MSATILDRLFARLAFELLDRLGSRSAIGYCPATRRRLSLVGAKWAETVRGQLLADGMKSNGGRVLAGPFSGMILPSGQTWGDGDLFAKLHGLYELEILELLRVLQPGIFDAAINIGCADGYYAVGLAKYFQPSVTYAVDVDPTALKSCAALAAANECSNSIILSNETNSDALSAIAQKHKRLLVLSDCEGFELDLFSSSALEALRRSHLIIECHDGIVEDCTARLKLRLEVTHSVLVIEESWRNPNVVASLKSLPSLDRWAAISEGRQQTMTWLYGYPKPSSTNGADDDRPTCL
jgi:hypothetical protein